MANLKTLEEAACELPNTLAELKEVVNKYGLAKIDDGGVDKYDFDKLKLSLDASKKVSLYGSLLQKYNELRDKASEGFDRTMKIATLLVAIGAGVVAYCTLDTANKSLDTAIKSLNDANASFRAGNFYRVESDLVKSEAAIATSTNVKLAVNLFQEQIIRINHLYSYAGIDENAWKILLKDRCKAMEKMGYKLGGIALNKFKEKCEEIL